MAKPIIAIPDQEQLMEIYPTLDQLGRLAREIKTQIDQSISASDIAATYVRAEAALRQLEVVYDMVAAMGNMLKTITVPQRFEAGKTTSNTSIGYRVTISNQVRTSIRKEKKEEAFGWIKEAGHGDIIKTEPAIHPATLDAWARVQLEDGEDLPEDLFSIYHYQTTSLTKATSKK